VALAQEMPGAFACGDAGGDFRVRSDMHCTGAGAKHHSGTSPFDCVGFNSHAHWPLFAQPKLVVTQGSKPGMARSSSWHRTKGPLFGTPPTNRRKPSSAA
jgi:hypothetical protein